MSEREYPEELRRLSEMESESRDHRPTVAQILVELSLREVELWHTPDEESWATFHIEGRTAHAPIRSKGFRSWLARRYYEADGRVPGAQALQDALGTLEGEALFGDREHQVFIRVAEQDERVYIDLGREFVEVDADGWQIVSDVPVRFWRPKGFLPLPTPVPGGTLDELRPFIRTETEEDYIMAVSWLLGTLRPRGPYPILDITAEQGSGKSFSSKVLRSLVDPAEAPLRRPPRDEHGLFLWANNSHILAMDNLSGIQDWLSDALCVISTGGGYAVRQLYTDREENILRACNPIIANGIPELANRADLRDRTLLVNLRRMDERASKDEKALWAEFEAARPRLLGSLLTAVSAALRHWGDVTMDRKPRMADFCRWVCAAELGGALPWEPGRFLDAYMEQRDSVAAESLESDDLAQAVLQLIEGAGEWKGSATELLADLSKLVDDQTRRSRTWPRSPRNLSSRLRRLAPELRRGSMVEIWFGHDGRGERKKRVIRMRKKTSVPSVPSVPEVQKSQAWRGIAAGTQKAKDPDLSSPPGILSSPPGGAGDAKSGCGDDEIGLSSPQKPSNDAAGDDGDDGDDKTNGYSSLKVVDEL